jgi:apolipoprotein N-acyltransferase
MSIVSGILLALAFPKFNLFWIAWIALVPFFIALGKAKNWKESAVCGFLFGVVFFGIHLFWVNSLFRFAGWWVILGWVALVLFQTLFIVLFVLVFRLIVSNLHVARFDLNPFQPELTAFVGGMRRSLGVSSGLKRILYAVVVAFLWVAVEWLRAWGPFGVTGGDLGYSQALFLPVVQIASFSSVYGVSFLIVLFNVSLALFVVGFKRWQPLLLAAVLVVVSVGYGMRVMSRPVDHSSSMSAVLRGSIQTVKVSLIQPNIDQMDKLNPAKVLPIYETHARMTRQAMRERPEIVIWPESAVFTYLLKDNLLFPRVKRLLAEERVWLITGTPHYEKNKAFNSVVSISPTGKVISRYDKERPVPFGEYLPFRKILYPILRGVGYYDSEFAGNPNPQVIKAKNLNIATAVCFESTFPDLIKKRVRKNSDFILIVTNDAWFGNSAALEQHLNSGVLRAIENRKYFIQAGNTGISAVIDPFGRVLKKTGINQRGILTFEIPLS